DHVNGLLGADDKPAFPNAEILVPAAEHRFWMDDGEMSRATPGRMQGLFKDNRRVMSGEILKRTATYEWGKEIAPGITSVSTPGHTVGHTSYVIASGSARLFVFSDVTNRPELFVRNPGWHAFFDQIPDMAETTRRKVLDMLIADKMLVQTFHAPFPALGHMEKDGQAYRFVQAPGAPAVGPAGRTQASGTSGVRCRPMPGTSAMRSRLTCGRCCRSRDRLRARGPGANFSWDVLGALAQADKPRASGAPVETLATNGKQV